MFTAPYRLIRAFRQPVFSSSGAAGIIIFPILLPLSGYLRTLAHEPHRPTIVFPTQPVSAPRQNAT
jgi:hypothetical protein